jgi:hypothetical protein
MVLGEVNELVHRSPGSAPPAVDLAMRARFNPNLEHSWFGGLMEIVNNVTLLSIILAGAALIREREHGTIEHRYSIHKSHEVECALNRLPRIRLHFLPPYCPDENRIERVWLDRLASAT